MRSVRSARSASPRAQGAGRGHPVLRPGRAELLAVNHAPAQQQQMRRDRSASMGPNRRRVPAPRLPHAPLHVQQLLPRHPRPIATPEPMRVEPIEQRRLARHGVVVPWRQARKIQVEGAGRGPHEVGAPRQAPSVRARSARTELRCPGAARSRTARASDCRGSCRAARATTDAAPSQRPRLAASAATPARGRGRGRRRGGCRCHRGAAGSGSAGGASRQGTGRPATTRCAATLRA